ncbi:MAG: phospholipase D-like domain-containing protein [Oscillospiraceae bacterium]
MVNNTDTKFFTNEFGSNLYKRFNDTLENARYFDALVGYFRTSGFHRLYNSLSDIEKIRILVGINTDYETYKFIQDSKQINFLETQVQTKEFFNKSVINEFENSEDSFSVEESVSKFKELLKANKLEIKAFPSDKIHAKVYITRYKKPVSKVLEGSVVTGSSNFTENGLNAQYEFNVELKDPSDYKYALNKFEELWLQAVDVSAEYIETINSKTWLSDEITPYEIYLKFLYEYFYDETGLSIKCNC